MLLQAGNRAVIVLLVLVVVSPSWASSWSEVYAKAKQMWDAGDHKKAAAIFEEYAADANTSKSDRFKAKHAIALFHQRIRQYKESVPLFRKAIDEHTLAEDDGGVSWIVAHGQFATSLYQVHQHREALKLLESLEALKVPENFKVNVSQAISLRAQIYSSLKEYDKAFRAALDDFRRRGGASVGTHLLSEAYDKVPDPLSAIDDFDEDMATLWQALFDMIHRQDGVHDVYSIIVDLLLEQGEYEQALFEARNLVVISVTDEQMEKAMSYLSIAVKASDGSVHRANSFLAYQRYGKAGEDRKVGTDDDLANPFSEIGNTNLPEREERFKAALKKIPRTWDGRLARARLCHIWGQPIAALKELKVAFALCPLEQEPLQRVTDQVVSTLVEITGDVSLGDSFIQFQKFGAAGPDGKMGTDDDLKNPVVTVLNASKHR